MIGYGNRGKSFEELIKMINSRYLRNGVAVIHKVPTEFIPLRGRDGKVVGCKVEEKSCVDFLGRFQEKAIAFEAKHTASEKIDLKAVKEHQAKFLDQWDSDGKGIAFVIVSFNLDKIYVVPWLYWKIAIQAQMTKTKCISVNFNGVNWSATGKASIRQDEMHPCWEVEDNGVYDYLGTVKELFKL